MIAALEVEGFRGFRRLKVEGLGRVNLIIGRNNSGKTALMEAMAIAADVSTTAFSLVSLQENRLPNAHVQDFNRFWLPLFLDGKADNGFTIVASMVGGPKHSVNVRRGEAPHDITVKSRTRTPLSGLWTIEIKAAVGERFQNDRITANSETINLPAVLDPHSYAWWWVRSNKGIEPLDIQSFSDIKQMGRESLLLDVLRQVDSRLSSIDLLAPTGDHAELFVRLGPNAPLLNMAMMGDGFQRCFEFGVAAAATAAPSLLIDEFENGLHHSVLEPIWHWLASVSVTRKLQIFATTHSEECVQAACRAFTAAGDDGLRVIRLDQREEETVATVYDRSLVEAATQMGVEIRG